MTIRIDKFFTFVKKHGKWSYVSFSEDQMIVIIHDGIAVDEDAETVMVVFEDFEKLQPVGIIKEYLPSFIASACDVI